MKKLWLSFLAVAIFSALTAPSARAVFEFEDVDLTFTGPDGTPAMEAGSHPYAMTNSLAVKAEIVGSGAEIPTGQIRDLTIDLPPGFAGNPTATQRCSNSDFALIDPDSKQPNCANATALGIAELEVGFGARQRLTTPVYNLVPAPGTAAKLGFVVSEGGVPVTIDVGLSEKPPYHVVAKLTNISEAVLFYSSKVTLWGNPASSEHDSERGRCALVDNQTCSTDAPESPFLTLPTACTGPLTTTFNGLAWNTGEVDDASATTHNQSEPPEPLGIVSCGSLGFAPVSKAQPTSSSAESPSGLDVEVTVKDQGLTDPLGKAQSSIKKASLTLPEGMTINPSQAEGLGVCSETDLDRERANSEPGQGCPNSSKIGTIEVETPLLEGKILKGSLFVAAPYQNPFGTLIALYMVIRDPELGIVLKLPGKVEPNSKTGQLTGTFDDLPQLPFNRFKLHFREGGRSPLVTPPACGAYTADAAFTPWASPGSVYPNSSSFTVTTGVGGGACPAAGIPPFSPGFEGGSVSNAAGRYSPFFMRLTRRDGDQDMTRFSAILPPGVTGKIAGVPRCPDAALEGAKAKNGLQERAEPSCSAATQIGRVVVGAGVGPELTYVPGNLYLAGPYKGAPLSVAAITPAVAGPFDAGNVVVRVGLKVNPITAEVEVDGAASDPIPHILQGIPLKVRDVRVYSDRPQFMLNPTSCTPSSLRASLFGSFADVFNPADDVPVALSVRYQAADCANLAFKPRLNMSLKGGTRRGNHPALRSVLTPRPGDANLGRATVTLPPSEFIDNAHIRNPCTRVQFDAGACPPGSVLGTARAFTPLLDEPLEGPVYFRSNGGERLLPDIVLDLRGTFHVIAVGFVDSKNARVRTVFASPPDAPLSKLVVNFFGGKRGLLVNNRNLCAHPLRAKLELKGQNGRMLTTRPTVGTSCKGKKGSAKAKRAG